MALAAHSTTLKISGTAVPVTGEATTSLGGGAYQITSSSRRIMAPSATPVVKDGGTPVSSALYAVNYQFGIITFDGYSPGGAITVDYSYLPTQAIAEVFTFNFSVKADLLDTTSYDSGRARAKKAGLVDASGSVGFRSLLTDEVDSVSHATLADVFEGGTPKLLEALCEKVSLKKLGIKGIFCGGTEFTQQWYRFAREELLGPNVYITPTYGNTLMGLAVHKPLTAEDGYAIVYYPPTPRAMIEVVDPDNPTRIVDYGKTGRVRLTTLTKETFIPRFLERDECERERPHELYPWDGVRNVRPFSRFGSTVVEGVY